ncbi:M48 family metallopeptidase [Bacteroides helcogenes]|uniref:WD40-like beta Propeller containing protein n=1 Tax=Bacteroides helcogenes (strain ATCC 35417 / DSM 20613 / JCM 6297 / CCUG 15421 / P 36-108) TaxID=693979 RepID=E6SWV2_BACT6|nr:tetratricopeptide repeat protein [Bacteroides helcogenes]ADV43654.1 WD40-like beta Propeller containing protein [Bacteroides helcogenes P 36-108]MDY5239376.1 tetratricopeptide repeat protein [Bacteroides helcogenes]
MKKKYILFFLFGFLSISVSAQTLAEAKALYEKEQYEEAKPVFRKFVKAQPANGSYNLWYGICCLKTGEPEEALKHLETAVKKRIPGGQIYLAQNYNDLYRFEDAIRTYEDYISELSRRKRPMEEAEKLLEKSKNNFRMLKGVEEVCFIDSFVVDKKNFLESYKISPESGKLFMYSTYFQNPGKQGGTVYETELGNKVYYSEQQPDGTLSILSRNKLLDKWSQGSLLPGSINEAINASYPYVLTDGITIYYAADGAGSFGGYDIYVTRYNTNTDSYLTPENVGMPFNSPYNDYMYVIDEFNDLGWFASDRYQPEDKVCIYVFIPNPSKQVYNYEETDSKRMIQLARLHSIKDTWTNKDAVNAAKERLQNMLNSKPKAKKNYDFEFVIDDYTTYHQLSDFQSPDAKVLFGQYGRLEKSYRQQSNKLEEMRSQYAQAGKNEKTKMSAAILDLEKRVRQLSIDIEQLAIQIRNLEKRTIK